VVSIGGFQIWRLAQFTHLVDAATQFLNASASFVSATAALLGAVVAISAMRKRG
jgi:gamma-glutamyl phosphate reductase